MAKKDYYQILGLPNSATEVEIKRAYRKLAMQYHPDRNRGKESWANENFKQINEAFSVLGDQEKRRQYDQFGLAGNIDDIFGSRGTRTTFDDLTMDFEEAGLDFDFLDNIFGYIPKRRRPIFFNTRGKSAGNTQGMRFDDQDSFSFEHMFEQAQHPDKHNVNYEITLTIEQAGTGIEKNLTRNSKSILIKIPPGVNTGSKVKLKNALMITDGQPGDIIVNIRVN